MRTHAFTEPRACPLHSVMLDISDDDYGPFGDFDDEDDDTFDCMMGPDGQCGKAGSEECEFDCPTMRAWRRGDI